VLHGVKISVLIGVTLGVDDRDDRRDRVGDKECLLLDWSRVLYDDDCRSLFTVSSKDNRRFLVA